MIQDYKDKALTILIIVAVICAGLFAINQYISFRYKAVFLEAPCKLCQELNPRLQNCFYESSIVYTDPVTGKEIEKEDIKIIQKENYFNASSLNNLISSDKA